jgi:hypothetical protein
MCCFTLCRPEKPERPSRGAYVVTLALVAEEEYRAAPAAGRGLANSKREASAFGRTRARVRSMITDGLQQIAEERAFGVPRLVLALRMVAGHFRVLAREQQSHILDRAGLANARWSIDERTGIR